MNDDARHRGTSLSSAFSVFLSLARERVAELGCAPVDEDPQAFVDRGGLRRLETEAAEAAVRRVREAAYPLIFKLFGSKMPRGRERTLVLTRDLARIEQALGYRVRSTRDDAREEAHKRAPLSRDRGAAAERRRK
jgi:hypothetical protein